jgi:hypothetical protein
MTENANTDLRWLTIAFLFAIVMFGVVLVGQAPKWPIYATVLAWWGFVLVDLFMDPTTASK